MCIRDRVGLAVATIGALVTLILVLVVVDARRVRVDERPIEQRLERLGWDVDLAEMTVLEETDPTTVRIVLDVVDLDGKDQEQLSTMLADEVREQLGEDTRTRLVLRDVLPVD